MDVLRVPFRRERHGICFRALEAAAAQEQIRLGHLFYLVPAHAAHFQQVVLHARVRQRDDALLRLLTDVLRHVVLFAERFIQVIRHGFRLPDSFQHVDFDCPRNRLSFRRHLPIFVEQDTLRSVLFSIECAAEVGQHQQALELAAVDIQRVKTVHFSVAFAAYAHFHRQHVVRLCRHLHRERQHAAVVHGVVD